MDGELAALEDLKQDRTADLAIVMSLFLIWRPVACRTSLEAGKGYVLQERSFAATDQIRYGSVGIEDHARALQPDDASDAPWRAPSSRLANTRHPRPLPSTQDVGPYSAAQVS